MKNAKTFRDCFNMLTGDMIGEGEFRQVYECTIDPSLVVKVEREIYMREFPNLYEMKAWAIANKNPALRKWLAPCVMMSADARILLMKRCDPLPRDYVLPEKFPHFLDDIKSSNFGLLGKKLVCFDYAIVRFGLSETLKAPDWGRRDEGHLHKSIRRGMK